MPRSYSQNLRLTAIWLTEIIGFHIDKVSILLQMSNKMIYRFVQKFRRLGNVDTAVIGKLYNCIAMHPHEECVILKILLQHPDKMSPEIRREVYREAESEHTCST